MVLPPDCTGLLQPIDVGVGKAIKDKVRSYFHAYMLKNYKKKIKQNSIESWTFKNPTKNLIVEWVITAIESIKDFSLSSSINSYH